MYASRKVTMSTWAKEWGPGFLGEGKETHGSLELQGRGGEGSAEHS